MVIAVWYISLKNEIEYESVHDKSQTDKENSVFKETFSLNLFLQMSNILMSRHNLGHSQGTHN